MTESTTDINSDIRILIELAEKYSVKEPVYALLLCRQVGEAILMEKHLQIVKDGEPKDILTIGDLNNTKLKLFEQFNSLERAALSYIGASTNSSVHYQTHRDTIANKKLVDMVLEQIYFIIGDEYATSSTSVKGPQKIAGWKETLVTELEEFKWPSITQTILSDNNLSKLIGNCTKKINKRKNLDIHSESSHLEFSSAEEKQTFEEMVRKKKMGSINSLEKQRKKLKQLRSKSGSDRSDLIKRTTEAILIAFYSKVGGITYKNHEYIRDDGVIDVAIASVLNYPSITGAWKHKKHWEFLFIIKGKKKNKREVKLVHDWKFMYLDK